MILKKLLIKLLLMSKTQLLMLRRGCLRTHQDYHYLIPLKVV
ncbi:hypothetical protein A0H76_3054 [Hepatospora eriocheir]|uniref:Uncharacterized protein n=1 Tax=Hepatospora eriocheir TaxID=1081669 RepID=A0A1X0QEH4_9MICR|nr:hypothetical protein A0H76_3054 [Hepatospora eriocheir]